MGLPAGLSGADGDTGGGAGPAAGLKCPGGGKGCRLCQTALGRGGKDHVTIRLEQAIRTKTEEETNEKI